jgi:hypothetical protein
MPIGVVKELVQDLAASRAFRLPTDVKSKSASLLSGLLRKKFDLSRLAARIRLLKLGLLVEVK